MADAAKAADSPTSSATWQRWNDEYEQACKAKGYQQWQTRAKKIIKRYRDDRGDGDGASDGMQSETQMASKFNILWSNVQTLMPALFAKTPKPVVERRYLDRDDVGRTASVILERALLYELDEGGYQAALRKAVLDRLLPGRGVVWVRYEPKFTPMPAKTSGETADGAASSGDESLTKPDETETGEEVASESTCIDYVDWQDFQTSPARTWEEVWWVDRLVYMTRKELVARFGKKKGDAVPLDWSPNKDLKTAPSTAADTGDNEGQMRARVHETWCKTERKVYWWAKSWSDDMLDEKDDPLELENFWPVPKPLFSSMTNESLIPVPDYYEYQDQAVELDDLTNRIAWLTRAIKVTGLFDASIPELQRIFLEGKENELVGVDNMAEFSQKAGPNGMGVIWLAPMLDQIKTLTELFAAREQVKQSLYEITGISDIVRGAATGGGAKTATEQRIKGQFASMRLNDMQAEVARFARDTLRIMGEIIAEHFDPMTLFLVSGFEQYAKDQWPPEPPMPPPSGQPPMMGHNGPPPGPMPGGQNVPMGTAPGAQPMPQPMPGSMGAPMMPPPPDPAMVAQAKAADMFKQAIALIKNDNLRGFRIDIETDSLIEPDQQAMQQSRTELLAAIAQFLPQAIQAGMAMPQLKPLLARLLMFFLRGFKASRDIESAFEQFVDDMTKEAANPAPPPPSPEMLKAQTEAAAQQAETKRAELEGELKIKELQQSGQIEAAKLEQEYQLKMKELAMQDAIEREKLTREHDINMAKLGAESENMDKQHGLERDRMDRDAEMKEMEIDAKAGGEGGAKPGAGRMSKRMRELQNRLDRMEAESSQPAEIVRGPDGRAQGVKRGDKVRMIQRGPDGRAIRIQ